MLLKRLSMISVATAGCLTAVLMTGCNVRQSLEGSQQTTSWVWLSQQTVQADHSLTESSPLTTVPEELEPDASLDASAQTAAAELSAAGTEALEAYLAAGSPEPDQSAEVALDSSGTAVYDQSSGDLSLASLAADFPIIYSLNQMGEVRVTVLDREVLLTYVNPPADSEETDHAGIGRYVSKKVYDQSGALTLVLTPASYWELLSALQDEIQQQYNQLIELGLTPASWLSLDAELDIGEIYIMVDPEAFIEADKFDVPAIQTLASLYQLYDGVQPDSIQVTLVFQSQEDGSVLDVMDSALEQEPETETASVAKGSVPAASLAQP